LTIPIGVAAMIDGIVGARISLKTKPETLKKVFAYTTFAATLFMVLNAWFSKN
jgi:uncharacterized protein